MTSELKEMSRKNSGKRGKANIFDVAELAGVSIKTVSRVVNNEPNVQEKTRDKVLKAVAKLNFMPNSAARGLSGKRSYVIGLAYENPHEFSYMKDVLNGALEVCDRNGYSLLLRPLALPNDSLENDIRQFVLQTRLDGIILTAPICDDSQIAALLEDLKIPSAQISPRDQQQGSLGIVCNDEEASFSLTQFLISQGHKSIGFIKGHPDHAAADNRLKGYRRALKANRISYSRALVRQGYFTFDSGKACARKLLNLSERPSAIIASNDDMAAGVFFEAHEENLSIPGDLSVVGFDDTPIASHLWPPLTTVRQPISDMAETATTLLISRLQNREPQTALEPFNCELVIRNSTGPV
jgi:LacI family transcriptional regulator